MTDDKGFDPVQASGVVHPIDLGATYCDSLSGFTGVATSIAYTVYGTVRVLLSAKSDKANKRGSTYAFNLQALESVNGSRLEYRVVPSHQVKFLEYYTDNISGFEGRACVVHYSMNKCVQVTLATGNDDNEPVEEHFDIQSLTPVNEEVPAPTATSDTHPGAARGSVNLI